MFSGTRENEREQERGKERKSEKESESERARAREREGEQQRKSQSEKERERERARERERTQRVMSPTNVQGTVQGTVPNRFGTLPTCSQRETVTEVPRPSEVSLHCHQHGSSTPLGRASSPDSGTKTDAFLQLKSPLAQVGIAAESDFSETAVERTWHIHDSQCQILALTSRQESLNRLKLFPFRADAAPSKWSKRQHK